MLRSDETVTLTLTGQVLQILFAALNDAPMPRRMSDVAIEALRVEVLKHDPAAFDAPAQLAPPPRANGLDADRRPNADDWRMAQRPLD